MFNDFDDAQKRITELDSAIIRYTKASNPTHSEKMAMMRQYGRTIKAMCNGEKWACLIDNIDCRSANYDIDEILEILYAKKLTWPNGQAVDDPEWVLRDGIESAVLFVELMDEILHN